MACPACIKDPQQGPTDDPPLELLPRMYGYYGPRIRPPGFDWPPRVCLGCGVVYFRRESAPAVEGG